MKKLILSSALAVSLGSSFIASSIAQADGIGVGVICTGPQILICIAAAPIVHEGVVAANGEKPFGPNGEIMKILGAPIEIVDRNIKGAARESGELDKVLKGTTGISVKDIKKHGIFGGPNSIFRKPFG